MHSTKAAEVGSTVGIKFDPYDIHIMHKMKFWEVEMMKKHFALTFCGWRYYYCSAYNGGIFALLRYKRSICSNNLAAVSRYSNIFIRSIWLAAVATVICLIIAYPACTGTCQCRIKAIKRYSAYDSNTPIMNRTFF